MANRTHIGVSGLYHEHWKPLLNTEDLLSLLARDFSTAEVRYTLNHRLSTGLIENWLSRIPKEFILSIKAPDEITRCPDFQANEGNLKRFLDSLQPLGTHLGPIVFDWPRGIEKDMRLIEGLIGVYPGGCRYVFEFRHKSWFDDEVFRLLESHGIGFCITHAPRLKPPIVATADFAYLKFYGASRWYNYNYSEAEIDAFAKTIRELEGEGRETFVYFNNDEEASAYHNARQLMDILSRNS